MARTISIGAQGFEDIRANGYFYVDKTGFVRDWWSSGETGLSTADWSSPSVAFLL